MKKSFILLSALLLITSLFFSCKYGEYILIVSIDDQSSEIDLIKESLKKGGEIVLSVSAAREIDADFDTKYAVSDSTSNFFVKPALLNFIGGNGWKLKSIAPASSYYESEEYYFTKQYIVKN